MINKKLFLHLGFAAAFLTLVSCSQNRKSTSYTGSDTSDSGSDFGFGDTDTSTATNTNTDSTASTAAASLPAGVTPSSLFDQFLGNDQASSTTSQGYNSSEQQCLGQSSAYGQSACYQSSQGSVPSANSWYQFGSQNFSNMEACLAIVLQNAPQSTDAPQVVAQKFWIGRIALVRCFRAILQTQIQFAPWGSNQLGAYGYTDYNYNYLLNQFGSLPIYGNH